MTLTKLQEVVQEIVQGGESVLLVAPTGIGKTLAVIADLAERRTRTIYGVPLRALAGSILSEIRGLKRNGTQVAAVVHHGSVQDSQLFSEEVVVTTYDQIVCAVPGLPLSLPLSAGHAVAGALLMSRLVLDEAHLAWGISPEALNILLGILKFRQDLGLQTIFMTATLPRYAAELIAKDLGMRLIFAGDKENEEDEGLEARKQNRSVKLSKLEVTSDKSRRAGRQGQREDHDLLRIVEEIGACKGKRIYFANTVDRLQLAFDLLAHSRFEMNRVNMLHNRMPRSWRDKAEKSMLERFGKESVDGDFVLLTNQVAEAGLDISAPLVISDPAPVDTLIQRAGRCARWFRAGPVHGEFKVISTSATALKEKWSAPYRPELVQLAMGALDATGSFDWDGETKWLDEAWGGGSKKAVAYLEKALRLAGFALNLFDRAAQQQSPGTIASAFREILSVQVAVRDQRADSDDELLAKLRAGHDLDGSSISLRQGYSLISVARGKAQVIRYRGDDLVVEDPSFLTVNDTLLVPPNVAYLHDPKGLCFGDGLKTADAILSSGLIEAKTFSKSGHGQSAYQSLWQHTKEVMKYVEQRLLDGGDYRSTLLKILGRLETGDKSVGLADAIARLSVLATGFHDLGKADKVWQQRARAIDPSCPPGLIGRTAKTGKRIGVPHTPQGFFAAVAACKAAIGHVPETDHLVRAIALAAARHHSSSLNPATIEYDFDPAEGSAEFVNEVFEYAGLSSVPGILAVAKQGGAIADVPLMLPNDDLFPIYALVGRAILISDRESASGSSLEEWRVGSVD